MSQIKPGIYIGNWKDANNKAFLHRWGITHVLCCAFELHPVFPNYFTYKHIVVNDLPTSNIGRYLDQAADFINLAVNNREGKILVHWYAGISRSTSWVLAYLIKYEEMTLSNALVLCKSKRYIVNPNPGFMEQLKDFEKRVVPFKRQSKSKTFDEVLSQNRLLDGSNWNWDKFVSTPLRNNKNGYMIENSRNNYIVNKYDYNNISNVDAIAKDHDIARTLRKNLLKNSVRNPNKTANTHIKALKSNDTTNLRVVSDADYYERERRISNNTNNANNDFDYNLHKRLDLKFGTGKRSLHSLGIEKEDSTSASKVQKYYSNYEAFKEKIGFKDSYSLAGSYNFDDTISHHDYQKERKDYTQKLDDFRKEINNIPTSKDQIKNIKESLKFSNYPNFDKLKEELKNGKKEFASDFKFEYPTKFESIFENKMEQYGSSFIKETTKNPEYTMEPTNYHKLKNNGIRSVSGSSHNMSYLNKYEQNKKDIKNNDRLMSIEKTQVDDSNLKRSISRSNIKNYRNIYTSGKDGTMRPVVEGAFERVTDNFIVDNIEQGGGRIENNNNIDRFVHPERYDLRSLEISLQARKRDKGLNKNIVDANFSKKDNINGDYRFQNVFKESNYLGNESKTKLDQERELNNSSIRKLSENRPRSSYATSKLSSKANLLQDDYNDNELWSFSKHLKLNYKDLNKESDIQSKYLKNEKKFAGNSESKISELLKKSEIFTKKLELNMINNHGSLLNSPSRVLQLASKKKASLRYI